MQCSLGLPLTFHREIYVYSSQIGTQGKLFYPNLAWKFFSEHRRRKGRLQEHGWLKGRCITEKPTSAWVITFRTASLELPVRQLLLCFPSLRKDLMSLVTFWNSLFFSSSALWISVEWSGSTGGWNKIYRCHVTWCFYFGVEKMKNLKLQSAQVNLWCQPADCWCSGPGSKPVSIYNNLSSHLVFTQEHNHIHICVFISVNSPWQVKNVTRK